MRDGLTNQTIQGYKEVDLLLGYEVKNNPDVEFRYVEPKKLQEIYLFFVESFLSICKSSDLYYNTNHLIKYADYSFIKSIDEFLGSCKLNFVSNLEDLMNNLREYLLKNYIKSRFEFNNLNSEKEIFILSRDITKIERDVDNLTKFLEVRKQIIHEELLKDFIKMSDVNILKIKISDEMKYNDNSLQSNLGSPNFNSLELSSAEEIGGNLIENKDKNNFNNNSWILNNKLNKSENISNLSKINPIEDYEHPCEGKIILNIY